MSVRKSLAWSYGNQAATFLLTFGTSVVVARLLSPREMGIYAMAFAVSGVVSSFTTFGVSSYVVREAEMPREVLRAAYTTNACLAVTISALLMGVSIIPGLLPPDVAFVLRLIALNPLIGLFEFTPWALSTREARFGLVSSVTMLRTTVNAFATMVCAFAGFGAASLAIGALIGYLVSIATYNIVRRRDILLLPTFKGMRPIIMFGLQMMSISGASQIAARGSDLILGKLLGLEALGLYSRASGLANQVYNNVYGLASNVLFVRMSEELRTTGSLHRIYMRAIAILTAIMWPLVTGVAVLARPFVAHVYGEKWLAAAAPLSLLMIAQFIILGFGMSWELFVLRKQTALQTRFELIRAVVGTATFAAGAVFSLTGAAIGRVVDAVFGYVLYRPHMDRFAGADPGELERVYLRSAALTVAAVLPSLLLMLWTDWSPRTDLIEMIAAVLLGALLWLATMMRQRHPLFQEMTIALSHLRARSVIRDA